jgi:hypothetical protein
MSNFCIFIISNGRFDKIKTLKSLNTSGYTGAWYIVVDNEDKTIDKYRNKFGHEKVIMFDKKAIADQTDEGNNFDNRRTTTHARNACFDIAMDLGYKYFLVLDDDYTSFEYRYEADNKLKVLKINNIDEIIKIYLKFYINSQFQSIAMAQGGDFIGGVNNPYVKKRPLIRKCMNSFFCSIDRRFWFVGQLNEDVNTYVTLGHKGKLFGTVPMISLVQAQTQATGGGMTDAYNHSGTYVKSFYSVMYNPSAVKVSMLNSNNPRVHHNIKWQFTVPLILSEKYKK